MFFIDLVAWIRWRGDSDELGIPLGRCSPKKATSSCAAGAIEVHKAAVTARVLLQVCWFHLLLHQWLWRRRLQEMVDGVLHKDLQASVIFYFCEVFCAKVSEQLVFCSVLVVSTYVTCC
jgi:hypothetical protein